MTGPTTHHDTVSVTYEHTAPVHDGRGVHVRESLAVVACLGAECRVVDGRVLIVPHDLSQRRPWPDHIEVRPSTTLHSSHTLVWWADGAWACSCGGENL